MTTDPHDLGGRSGFGPVPVDDDVVFHADWERRAFAVTQYAQDVADFTTDAFRHGIERDERYPTLGYFDKWIRNAERMLVEGGVLGDDAVDAALAGERGTASPERTTDATAPEGRGSRRAIDDAPRFGVGDAVRAAAAPPPVEPGRRLGHHRLPAYVRGRSGTVVDVDGGWVLPDANAHGLGERPTWVYTVRFAADDLWPDDDGARHVVHVDLFEPHLEPAP